MTQQLIGKMRAAVERYNMIEKGDCVAVGVSGGKDSLFLLYGLSKLSEYYPETFKVKALTVDPCFNNEQTDYSKIQDFCNELGIELIIKRSELSKIIFEDRNEKSPCSLCARMRRGILHNMAKENGCNRIALGHHYDDAVETFFMNILNGGTISCFSPKSYLSIKDLWLIRPMIFIEEKEIVQISRKLSLPISKSKCPVDGKTERQSTKELISDLSKKYPDLKAKVMGAMQRGEISGW
ncbi:MAG: tRNA 2-thiocytidine biosynthesis TtcA family protein [Bacillota bacterium]|nr:tRNA 2-thiocytidine biosynthesis TtcA family protein [Bacillota bacterium]